MGTELSTNAIRRPLYKRLWYSFLQIVCRVGSSAVCRIRCYNRQVMPRTGGALLLSNHQSHLDPVIAGLACDRHLCFLARSTLFNFAPFRWWISMLNAIPIDREGGGLAGLRATLKQLKAGDVVLIFPEGTRSYDGEVAPLKSGFCMLARRGKVPLVPMAIDGAFHAWPRTRNYPLPGVIHVCFAQPLAPEDFQDWSDEQLVAEVERRIRECHAIARSRRLSAIGQSMPAHEQPDQTSYSTMTMTSEGA